MAERRWRFGLPSNRQWSFFMPADEHFFIRWLNTRYRQRLTTLGKAVFWTAGLGVIFAAPGTQTAAYLVLCVAVGVMATAAVMSYLLRPRVEARRLLPPPPSAGQRMTYRVRMTNRGSSPARALHLAETTLPLGLSVVDEEDGGAAAVERLDPGEERTVTLSLRCPERGAFDLGPLHVGTSFPSGLARWPRPAGSSERLLVYPRFVTQHEFELPVGRRYQPGGISVSSEVGDAGEFFGTREYRDGDRVRDIHWASYARSGRLIVKEYREEYFVRVGLVLDTELPRRHDPASFEGRVSLAAGIADALARRDHIIDLFAAGETLYHLQAGRALARLDNVLDLLACVESVAPVDFSVVESRLVQEAQQLSSIVFLLWDWDESRARTVRRLRETGTGVRPIVVRDEPPTLPLEGGVVAVPARTFGDPTRAQELLR